jgi:RimJ/RimL family protein N-acetyltransferase
MNVRLRDVVASDLPALFEHQVDPVANRMAVVHPRDPAAFHAHWTKILNSRNGVTCAILLDEALVGHIACFPMEGEHCIGYWIAREYWGRGIATRALALLLEQVATRPLHARAARDNAASIRVLQRNGFAITGYRTSPASDRYPECEEALLMLS